MAILNRISFLKIIVSLQLSLAVILSLAIFSHDAVAQSLGIDQSKDAIAIRVMPNQKHSSPEDWYADNVPNSGAPSSVIVDGYEAVRDGRTVYVSAANLKNNVVYTNIYLISYTQDGDQNTMDIFGQIVKNWQFNVDLVSDMPSGVCVPDSTALCRADGTCQDSTKSCDAVTGNCVRYCTLSSSCPANQYCTSIKAKLIRDVKRMADLTKIDEVLTEYMINNNTYPQLLSGTYLSNKTNTAWPSWNETLGKQLDLSLPKDPVNRLGACADNFDPVTCWDEGQKQFAANYNNPVLPPGSLAYVYQWFKDSNSFQLCGNYETEFANLLIKYRCDNRALLDNFLSPIITFGNMDQLNGPFESYVKAVGAYEIDWNKASITPLDNNFNVSKWSDWTGWTFSGVGLGISPTTDKAVVKISAKDVNIGLKPFAFYNFRITVFDVKGNGASDTATIRICKPRICEGNSCGKLSDNCGGTLICPDCPTGQTCNNLNRCVTL